MKVEFDLDEVRQLAAALVEQLIKDADLPEADQSALRKWRSDATPGSDAIRDLAEKVNADLARTLENKKRSSLVKADWR